MSNFDLRAVLLTDIVDSTDMNARLGDDAMAALWLAHDERARELIRDWRGLEIGRSDGFLVLFDGADDALGFALAYHAALAMLQPPPTARVGMHVGPVTLRRNGEHDVAQGATVFEIDGIALPVAARVMSAAVGGQTLLSADAARSLSAPMRARLHGHGHWRMKGVEEPIELFQVCAPGQRPEPPPDSAKAYRVVQAGELWLPRRELPHNLPAERDAFIGRGAALAELAARFARGARLVSVIGIGGIGKTRLVQRYGRTWLGEHPGGTWFCDLSQARGLDGIVHAVAQGLQVPLGSGDPVEQLGRAIAGRGACLVILDNFEQVCGHAQATLGAWLDRAGAAGFLVTTRERLGLVGEETLELQPLPPAESAALFMRRAEAASAGFDPGPADRASIEPLMRLLDGLPLAVELAAARVRVMAPRLLLQRMTERFKLLASTGARPDRQATLRGAFDWSWALLGAAEKSALAQLSVFEGGFTLAAAEAFLDLTAHPEAWPLDMVQALVDKSLLRRVNDHRFDLLRSVQDYAAEHLATPGRFEGSGPDAVRNARLRHARWFAALDEPAALADGCIEIDNLAAACRRAAEDGDVAAATSALVLAWAALRISGPFRAALDLVAAVEAMVGLDASAKATVGWVAGSALYQMGQVAAARTRYEEAMEHAAGPDSAGPLARLHCSIGELLSAAGDSRSAERHLNEALAFAEAREDGLLQCRALNGLGALAGNEARLGDAAVHYQAALSIATRLDDRRWQGGVLGNLGWLRYSQGDVDEAQRLYERALAFAVETGDRRWEGNARCNLGLLLHERKQSAAAGQMFEAALSISRQIGQPRLEATVLCNLGLLAESRSDLESACTLHEQAVDVMRSLGDRRAEGLFRIDLGRLLSRLGHMGESRRCLGLARQLLEGVGDKAAVGQLLCRWAELELDVGDLYAAGQRLKQARPLIDAAGMDADSELGRLEASTRARLAAAKSQPAAVNRR